MEAQNSITSVPGSTVNGAIVNTANGVLQPYDGVGNFELKYELCPSRGIRGGGGGAGITDYTYVAFNSPPTGPNGQPVPGSAILDTGPAGVTLTTVTNANGTSNTAMVSHLYCNPVDYPSGPSVWYNAVNSGIGTSVPDNQASQILTSPTGNNAAANLSSPHPGVNIVLFADGHVTPLTHGFMTQYQAYMWVWANTTPFSLP
jgi:prepilin-type processing-associated H-X9-DG protein